MKKIIIDTDPGIDDAFAILYAMACRQFDLIGVTTVFGNADIETTTRNALWLLEQLGQSDIPVARGASVPLSGKHHISPVEIHGKDGFGPFPARMPNATPVAENAADFMARVASENPGEVTVIALGPLTNIAEALTRNPDFATDVAEILVMGGAFETAGNKTPYAEANIANDAKAAQIVASSHALTSFVGLDITNRILLAAKDIQAVSRANRPKMSDFLQQIGSYYIDFYASKGMTEGAGLHDPATIIAAHSGELFEWHRCQVDIQTEGKKNGYTGYISGTGTCRITLNADLEGIKSQFMSALTKDAQGRSAAKNMP